MKRIQNGVFFPFDFFTVSPITKGPLLIDGDGGWVYTRRVKIAILAAGVGCVL